MKILFLSTLLLVAACSYVEVTEGTEMEKIKINAKVSDNCKMRVKVSEQKLSCKWRL